MTGEAKVEQPKAKGEASVNVAPAAPQDLKSPTPSQIPKPRNRRLSSFIREHSCAINPACFCELKNSFLLVMIVGIITDLFYMCTWVSFIYFGDSITYTMYAGATNQIAVDLLIMHGFCMVTNLMLALSIQMRLLLPTIIWIGVRAPWFYLALSAWIQSLNVYQSVNYELSLRYIVEEEYVIWQIIMWSYWPMVIFHVWSTTVVVIYACQLVVERQYRQHQTSIGLSLGMGLRPQEDELGNPGQA